MTATQHLHSPPLFDLQETADREWTIRITGDLTIAVAGDIRKALMAALTGKPLTSLVIDLNQVAGTDDYGALVLYELKHRLRLPDDRFRLLNPPDLIKGRLAQMTGTDARPAPPGPGLFSFSFVTQTGERTLEILKEGGNFISFIGALVVAGMRIAGKPKSLRLNDMVRHMKTTGVDALPVVALISALLGLIMAFMSSLQLKQFGANIYVASLVAVSMVSELGPVMTAIIVSGRSGSAYAAEISTMKISEEIDALVTMGFDPVLFLAIPRMLAAVIVIPLLTMFSNLFAIAGGLLIGVTMLDLSAGTYISQTLNSLSLFELCWGLSKSVVFAILISGVGCLRGFQAKGGAAAVGHAATSAVVTSIFLIVLFDSIFAVIRSYWG